MFCGKCGSPINGGEKFCPKCGAAVTPAAGNAAATATVEGAEKVDSKGNETLEKLNKNAGGKLSKLFNSKKKILLIVGAAALLAVILCGANGLAHFVHNASMSPEEYYQYIEEKAMQDVISCVGEVYDSYILQSMNIYDRSAEAELAIELEEAGQDWLELAGLAGVDLSWLKSVKIAGNVSVKNSVFGLGAALGFNKDDVLSAKAVADVEEGNVYLQIPELTSTYVGYELGNMYGDDELEMFTEIFTKIQETNERLIKACPDRKKVEQLLEKYMKLAIGCVDNVSKTTETLETEDIEQEVTELEVEIDADTLQAVMETVLEELKEDKDVEKITVSICEALLDSIDELLVDSSDELLEGVDAEDVYERFLDGIDELLENVDNLDSADTLIMRVYVDGKGNVCGRTLEMGSYSIDVRMPKKGNQFGYELSVEASGTTLKIEGSGKESGNKISGDFEVKYNGASIVECNVQNLDTAKLKVGQLNGTVTVKAASGISKLIDLATERYAREIMDIQLTLTSEASKNSAKLMLDLIYDEDKIGTVSMSVKTGNGSNTAVPSERDTVVVEDEDDLADWLENIDWDKVVQKLGKTDLPSEVLDTIEDIGEVLEDGDIEDVMKMLYRYAY